MILNHDSWTTHNLRAILFIQFLSIETGLRMDSPSPWNHGRNIVKRLLVKFLPSVRPILGSQSNSFLALEISGRRLWGSSSVGGRLTTLDCEFVKSFIIVANSLIVCSSGFPTFTGSVTSKIRLKF